MAICSLGLTNISFVHRLRGTDEHNRPMFIGAMSPTALTNIRGTAGQGHMALMFVERRLTDKPSQTNIS
jgi:hypothetical protein